MLGGTCRRLSETKAAITQGPQARPRALMEDWSIKDAGLDQAPNLGLCGSIPAKDGAGRSVGDIHIGHFAADEENPLLIGRRQRQRKGVAAWAVHQIGLTA